MKLIRNIYAGTLMLSSVKIFDPQKDYRNKRVAIIGAADSAFDEKNGKYIDEHDVVVRINKAPHVWTPEKAEYIGSKFTYLYHSFYENDYSGGGPIDWGYYDKLGIEKIINPVFSSKGLRTHFSYYKRHRSSRSTYILSRADYICISKSLGSSIPTVGFSALMSVLQADFKEVYITGFTFFQTPYATGYRDHLLDKEKNKAHIKEQGLHDPDLEFKLFKQKLQQISFKKVIFDKQLQFLLQNEKI
ncbi:glycosyltransferase family 29 protein [Salinimicrobium oceani]|uniref:Glycosyltransferase family 29 (Sialyltransferase) n=1 Tax=Salinimicrobium oceani TaxID=2722702 RepID=A0ABX1D034_9FLAO|nr:glycosyltransferase family 29 protein [Salinimicrobium oceani]NJW53422.1 hypothetical protein [Salinimicrobium oceani]